jgi:hypothetical protein
MEALGRGRYRSARRSALAFLAMLAALAAAVAAAPAMKDWRIEPFEWHGKLEAGRQFTVRNPYGDVRARRADGTSAAVYAAMQRHRDDPRPWNVAIAEVTDGLSVHVELAAGTATGAAPAADWTPRRVDLTVYVPPGARLSVQTEGGLIEGKRLASDIEARSRSGEIVITTAGSVDARSQEGRIRYSFLKPDWTGAARLTTRSGDIILNLPHGANVDLAIHTRGVIAAGAALAPGASAPSRDGLEAKLGAGGSPVVVESETGRVEVQRTRV